jgi:hypothetical protein
MTTDPLAALLDPENAPARHGEWHPGHRPMGERFVVLTDDDGCDLFVEPWEIAVMVNRAVDATLPAPTDTALREAVMVPTALLRTEWPPNPDLTPGGSNRFDAVYDSLAAGEPMREPIKVRADNWTVIDGCHRLQSARLLGIALVPVRFWTGHEWLPALTPEDPTTDPQALSNLESGTPEDPR